MYRVELRNNTRPFGNPPVEAYLGEFERNGRWVWGAVRNVESAAEFETRSAADRELRRLSDEFFDRYAADIVKVWEPECPLDGELATDRDQE